MRKWEDFISREISLSPIKSREDLEDKIDPFNGPFIKRKFTIDEPTYYQANLKLFGYDETARFNDFVKGAVNVYGGFFLKSFVTPHGKREQLVRIIGGIPQGVQIGPSAWMFDFTVVIARFNADNDLLPPGQQPEDDYYPRGVYYIPRYWARSSMASAANIERVENPITIDDGVQSLERVSVSRSGFKVAVAAFKDGEQSRFAVSTEKGAAAIALPPNLGIDGTISSYDEVVAIHISDDTNTILVAFKLGGLYRYNYANSSSAAARILNVLSISSMSVSDDGMIVVIGVETGVNWLSRNGGNTWVLIGSIPGFANTAVRLSAIHAATKDYFYLVLDTTNALIKVNVDTLAKETLTLPISNEITSIAASSDGRRIFIGMVGDSEGRGVYSLDSGTTWEQFGNNFGQGPQVTRVDSVSTDDTGNVVLFCLWSGIEQAYMATVYYDASNDGIFTRELLTDGLVRLPSGTYERRYFDAVCGRYNWFVARGGIGLSQSSPDRIDPTIVGTPPNPWTPPPPQSLLPRLFQLVNLPSGGTGITADSAKYENVGYVVKSSPSNTVYVINLFDASFTTLDISDPAITSSTPTFVAVDGGNSRAIFVRPETSGVLKKGQIYTPSSGDVTLTDLPIVQGGGGDPEQPIELSDNGLKVVTGLFTYDDGTQNTGTVAISNSGGETGTFSIYPSGLGGGASLSQLYSFAVSGDGMTIIAGLNGGKIAISIDGGLTFTRNDTVFSGLGPAYTAKISYDGQVIMLMLGSNRLAISTDQGATWTLINEVTYRNFAGTSFINFTFNTNTYLRYLSNDGSLVIMSRYIGSSSGERLFASEDYGVTWKEINPEFLSVAGTNSRLISISGNGENYLMLFANGTAIIGRPDTVIG